MNELMESNPRLIRAQDAEDEAREARDDYLRRCFMSAVIKGDMNAVADWAPMVSVWENGLVLRKLQTVGEVLADVLDYRNGPSTSEVMNLLCKAAYGQHYEFLAYRLIERMAEQFVRHNR